MKRIDEKIDHYLNEGSIPLRFMNYSSDIGKFMIALNEMHDDIVKLDKMDKDETILQGHGDKMIDALEDIHMSLFFLKKKFTEIVQNTRAVPGKKLIGTTAGEWMKKRGK